MYSFEEHTADVRIIVKAENLERLFEEAAKALADFMVYIEKVEKKEMKEIFLESNDLIDLFNKFLNELLFYFDSEGFIWKDSEVNIENEYKLKAKVYGEKYDIEKHGYKGYIKAITFHEMEIKETEEGFEARFVIDI